MPKTKIVLYHLVVPDGKPKAPFKILKRQDDSLPGDVLQAGGLAGGV